MQGKMDPGRPERHGVLADWVLALNEVLAWYSRVVYTGHTLKKQDEGWLLVVRAYDNQGPLVCFVGAGDPEQCFRAFAALVKSGKHRWFPDKYA